MLAFPYYDKIPEKISLEEERFSLAQGFRVSVDSYLAPLFLGLR